MKQKGTTSGSEIYVNRKGSKIKELIMVMDGASSLKFVYMEGDMTTDDIKKLMLYQNTSQCFIISGDRLYTNNKPVIYDSKKDISKQKGSGRGCVQQSGFGPGGNSVCIGQGRNCGLLSGFAEKWENQFSCDS